MKAIALILLDLLMIETIESAHIMDSEKVLSFAVASSGITRISVESDRIVETFVDPQDSASAVKNNRGHIYVSGQKQIPHMYLSLITKTGQVQDIKLSFKDTAPKPILLKQPQQMTASTLEPVSAEQYLKWLQVFLKGNVPQSFEAKPLSNLEPARQSGGFTAEPVSFWIHPEGYRVTSYRIRLQDEYSKSIPDLKAEIFQQPGDLALVCNARVFSTRTETRLYVLQKTQSQTKGDIQ